MKLTVLLISLIESLKMLEVEVKTMLECQKCWVSKEHKCALQKLLWAYKMLIRLEHLHIATTKSNRLWFALMLSPCCFNINIFQILLSIWLSLSCFQTKSEQKGILQSVRSGNWIQMNPTLLRFLHERNFKTVFSSFHFIITHMLGVGL